MVIQPGTTVRHSENPGREGVVTDAPPRCRPSGTRVQVRWDDGDRDYVYEFEIEPANHLSASDPISLAEQSRYGRAADLRRNLTYVHLAGRLANLVYAMGITNTDFYAHQYRPLLTLLDSPVNGLLIADEVGLGKTIEAGLIWTELRARYDLRRLVIVCPAMLREKWRNELANRFGIDASICSAAELVSELSSGARFSGDGKAWIVSYQSSLPPGEWRPEADKRPERINARWKLAELLHQHAEEEPLVDLVVFDEAHYMRNDSTTSWRLGNLLRGAADYQLMLSATPINLRNQDLFNILKLLDPDHFASERDFQALIDANQPLIAARDTALNHRSSAADIIQRIREATNEPSLRHSRQLDAILKHPPTDEQLGNKASRAAIADSLERVNLLSHVVTRTRKKDVQERRIQREVRREAVAMNKHEQQLYDSVTEVTRRYAEQKGINDGFLLASPQRQVTSCPAAVAEAWAKGGSASDELVEDLEDEVIDQLTSSDGDDTSGRLRRTLQAIIPRVVDVEALRNSDSKFQRLIDVCEGFFADHPREKIVIFTTFRATATYLTDRLNERGVSTLRLWGGQTETKQEVIDRFQESPELRVLVSTEVASEGVDLQFCRVLVNYDLPWNPTRIEQRIGRIDRLGQEADLIQVWNLFFAGTIDDRIVSRLLERLGIFEAALGEAEAVVGEEMRKLESDLLSRPLTVEEENVRIEVTAQALENIRRQREHLEKNAPHMMAHGQRVIERIDAARELAQRVTDADLFIYVRDYLTAHAPGHRFVQEGGDPHLIRVQLPSGTAAALDKFIQNERLYGKTRLASGDARMCRFLNKISERPKKGEEIIHQFHPLVRFISKDLRERDAHFFPLVAVTLDGVADQFDIGTGDYAFFVRAWSFVGVREDEVLAASAVHLGTDEHLEPDLADRLVQLARTRGEDWIGVEHELDGPAVGECLELAEDELDTRYQEQLERKNNENADRAQFQLDSIERHLQARLPTLRETLQTHIAKGRQSLAKATQGKINKLEARMNTRKERIRDQKTVRPEKRFVCAGVVRVIR